MTRHVLVRTEISSRYGQFLRYAATGLLTAILYMVVVTTAVWLAGLPVFVAGALGYAVALPANYLLHKMWSFRSRALHSRALPRFMITVLCGFGLNSMVLQALPTEGSLLLLGEVVAMGAVIILNYLLFRWWVFPADRLMS